MNLNVEKALVIKTICEYHNMNLTDAVKRIWLDDFEKFTADEIVTAWHEWRRDDLNLGKKPRSIDLIKRMRSRHADVPMISLKPGDDENVRLMKKNMPDLIGQIAACKTSYEKFATCCIALGKPGLVSHAVGRMLLSKASDNEISNPMVAGI